MSKEFKIRAHHGMCLSFFEGKGYSNEFTEHMGAILRELEDQNPEICVVAEKDRICSKCPNLENGICQTADKVRRYDQQVMQFCGLEEHTKLTWKEFHQLVRERILEVGKRKEICKGCQWEEICEKQERSRIYTVTLNPSLDYTVSLRGFELGKTNRTREEEIFVGGKGLNVSMILQNLGMKSTALGFLAGFTGEEIEKRLQDMGIHSEWIRTKEGCSRINVKLKDYDGTEINGMGPVIREEDQKNMMEKLNGLKQGDVLVLAGSISSGLPDTIYGDMLKMLEGRGILSVVDATNRLLLQVLQYRPFLIKPNHHELGEIFQVELHTREEVIPYAKKLQEMGARNVLVSMAGEGAVLIAENGHSYTMPAPKGHLINAVGAGDSMVAGFLAGWIEQKNYAHAFAMGVAAGSASAFSEHLASKEEILEIYGKNVDTISEM